MATYLDRILDDHRRRAAADRRDVGALARAAAGQPPARGFASALRIANEVAVIAEIKRRSPSKGVLAPNLDPAAMAKAYEDGGAAAVSVLTDEQHFGGSTADLRAARNAVSLPVLRKDFTVSVADVFDARIMGADAVLLIVAALSPAELGELLEAASSVGIDALVEVHDESEAEVALSAGATCVGVNQRDLRTFEVDTHRAMRVAAAIPSSVTRVAESGIGGPEDVRRLKVAGFDAVLIGETLVRSGDPAGAVAGIRAGSRVRAVSAR